MVIAINVAQITGIQVPDNSTRFSDILIAESVDTRSKYYGKFSDKQVSDSWDRVAAREKAAFGYFGNDASSKGLKKFGEAYVSYINGLSPEEQNSVRYKGTKESMIGFLGQIEGEIAKEKANPGKKTKKTRLNLLDTLETITVRLKKKHTRTVASTTAINNLDRITLSEEATRNTVSLQSLGSGTESY
jgi:hypothetical protein